MLNTQQIHGLVVLLVTDLKNGVINTNSYLKMLQKLLLNMKAKCHSVGWH
jgi:hypothetical protein